MCIHFVELHMIWGLCGLSYVSGPCCMFLVMIPYVYLCLSFVLFIRALGSCLVAESSIQVGLKEKMNNMFPSWC